MDRSAFEARPFSILALTRAALPHTHAPLSGSRKEKKLLRLVPFDLFHIFNSSTSQGLYFTVSFLGLSAKNSRKASVCFVMVLWRPECNFTFFFFYFSLNFWHFRAEISSGIYAFFKNVLLAVHTGTTLGKWPAWCTVTLCETFIIIILYMFRATLCSSSGGRIVLIQHLV